MTRRTRRTINVRLYCQSTESFLRRASESTEWNVSTIALTH
jgi:hypothetical protein